MHVYICINSSGIAAFVLKQHPKIWSSAQSSVQHQCIQMKDKWVLSLSLIWWMQPVEDWLQFKRQSQIILIMTLRNYLTAPHLLKVHNAFIFKIMSLENIVSIHTFLQFCSSQCRVWYIELYLKTNFNSLTGLFKGSPFAAVGFKIQRVRAH